MGRFFITLVGAMSQWERENLSERVRMGMEQDFLEERRDGNIPFGYREENGKLVIDPNEAAVVRWIFEQYKHDGLHAIAYNLNKQGIKTRQGAHWGDQQVRYALTNPVYIGHLRYRGQSKDKEIVLKSQHEPIISEELFYETQKRIKERREEQSAKTITSKYPFSGILVCARCGSPMVGAKNKMRSKNGGINYYLLPLQWSKCSWYLRYAGYVRTKSRESIIRATT